MVTYTPPSCPSPPTDDLEDMSEEDVFLQKLAYLRGQAQVFLKMLNDMRRRLKELPPGSPASRQYR